MVVVVVVVVAAAARLGGGERQRGGGGGGGDGSNSEVVKSLYSFIRCFTWANGSEHIYVIFRGGKGEG